MEELAFLRIPLALIFIGVMSYGVYYGLIEIPRKLYALGLRPAGARGYRGKRGEVDVYFSGYSRNPLVPAVPRSPLGVPQPGELGVHVRFPVPTKGSLLITENLLAAQPAGSFKSLTLPKEWGDFLKAFVSEDLDEAVLFRSLRPTSKHPRVWKRLELRAGELALFRDLADLPTEEQISELVGELRRMISADSAA